MPPLVSVIIPTFNREGCLREAVASVLAQTYPERELIVVDDGSVVEASSILQPFASRLRCVRQSHHGVSRARNLGITLARGEWLAFLDSDDVWLPQKLAVQLEFLARHPEIKICQTEEIWIRNGERLHPKKYHQKPRGHCFAQLLERCLVSPSAVIIHREIFDAVGLFDESLPACEDYDLWLRIGWRYPLGLIDQALIVKRGGHPDQLSTTVPALDRYRIQALVKLLSREALEPDQRRLALDALHRKCAIYAKGCLKRGKPDEAAWARALLEKLASRSLTSQESA